MVNINVNLAPLENANNVKRIGVEFKFPKINANFNNQSFRDKLAEIIDFLREESGGICWGIETSIAPFQEFDIIRISVCCHAQ